jgi:hypothetical protein
MNTSEAASECSPHRTTGNGFVAVTHTMADAVPSTVPLHYRLRPCTLLPLHSSLTDDVCKLWSLTGLWGP